MISGGLACQLAPDGAVGILLRVDVDVEVRRLLRDVLEVRLADPVDTLVGSVVLTYSVAKGYVGTDELALFAGIGAANIKDGYELNGTPKPEFPDSGLARTPARSGAPAAGDAFESVPAAPALDVFDTLDRTIAELIDLFQGSK